MKVIRARSIETIILINGSIIILDKQYEKLMHIIL